MTGEVPFEGDEAAGAVAEHGAHPPASEREPAPGAGGPRPRRVRVAVPGRRGRGRSLWPRIKLPVIAGAALLGALAVIAAVDTVVQYLPAMRALEHGRTELVQAEDDLRAGLLGDAARLRHASALLAAASDDFGAASSVIDDGILARVLGRLPVAGPQVAGVRALRATGEQASRLGLDVVPIADLLLAPAPAGAPPASHLTRLVDVGTSHRELVDRVRADAQALQAAYAAIPDRSLAGPLESPRQTLRSQVPRVEEGIRSALSLLDALPAAIGTGTHRYLFILGNPGEQRPGGGFIGTIGQATFADGRLVDASFELSNAVDAAAPQEPAPRPLDAYLFHGRPLTLSDANWSPDFPTSASLIARYYSQATGVPLDGVIGVDPVALAYVLGVIGPVQLAPYPQTVTADNALLELNYLINQARPGDPGKGFEPSFGRQLLQRIIDVPGSSIPSLAEALQRGAREKHIVVFFADPALERRVDDAGYAGRLPAPLSDSLLVADANLSGNKLDLFVQRRFELTARVESGGEVHDHLVLTYANPVQTDPANAQLVGSVGGEYRDYLRVYVPVTARVDAMQLSVGGASARVSPESVAPENGRLAIAYVLIVPRGATATVTLEYSGPFADITQTPERYALEWQKQLMALPWQAAVSVEGPGGNRLRWSGALDSDRRLATGV